MQLFLSISAPASSACRPTPGPPRRSRSRSTAAPFSARSGAAASRRSRRGQWDGARALALTRLAAAAPDRRCRRPLRIALPPTVGFPVQAIKSTSLASDHRVRGADARRADRQQRDIPAAAGLRIGRGHLFPAVLAALGLSRRLERRLDPVHLAPRSSPSNRREQDGVPQPRPQPPQGLAALPRHHDVRRPDRARREPGASIAAARDAGINFIDTADVYTSGASEEMVGAAIRDERDRWILATKLGNEMARAAQRARLVAHAGCCRRCDASLAPPRHRPHRHLLPAPRRPDDAARGAAARDRRPARAPARSATSASPTSAAGASPRSCTSCDAARHRPPGRLPAVLQPAQPHARGRESCRPAAYYGLGVVPYSPLARGVLTGKYAPGAAARGQPRGGATTSA